MTGHEKLRTPVGQKAWIVGFLSYTDEDAHIFVLRNDLQMPATDSADPPALLLAADADVSNWIEALAADECTPDEFIAEIKNRESEDPEVAWEALALLDQQFRREKINHEVFVDVKTRLQRHSMSTAGRPLAQAARSPDPQFVPAVVPAATPLPLPLTAAARSVPEEAAPHRRLRMGDQLAGHFRVVDILHSDAFGTLVEALDEHKINLPGIRRRVAIHVMDARLARSPQLLARLGKLQGLSHPSIARLLDVEEHGGTLLLVMELLNGSSLQDLQSRRSSSPVDVTVATRAVRSVASALVYAHSQGVTHGNVDPLNVVINQMGEAFLQGFHLQWTHSAEPAADRLAFAWLAYGLLSGAQASAGEPRRGSRLVAPPTVTREQWRLLRDTLTGKDGAHGDLLAAFAGDTQATVRPRSGRRSIGRAAGASLAVLLGLGAIVYLSPEREITTAAAPATSASPAPIVALPAPLAASSPTAAQVDIPPGTAPATKQAAAVAARPYIDMPAAVTWVETTAPVARIRVRRRGDLNGAVTFQWWTESGSAVPDRDFRRIDSRTGTIPSGATGTELLVPLMPDAERREARTFYVKIDAPGPRATLGARTLMQVAIVPPGYPAQFSAR